MAVSKEQILAALAKVPSPGGAALTDARVLSNVVVTDGKVFFSLVRRRKRPCAPCPVCSPRWWL